MKISVFTLTVLAAFLHPALRAEDRPGPAEAPASEADRAEEAPGETPSDGEPSAAAAVELPGGEARAGKRKPRSAGAAPRKAGPRDRPDGRDRPGPRGAGPEKRTWLGIATHELDESLRSHLEIPEGFAIQIAEVVPDSPASSAGLRRNDVIVRFEDQRLISPQHLALLVRSTAPGESIALTLLRKGREEVVDVVLGESDKNVFEIYGTEFPPRSRGEGLPWQEQIRRQQDEILRLQRPPMDRRRGQPGRPPLPRSGERGGRAKDLPGERPPGFRVNPGFPLRVFGKEGVLKIDNEQGELTLTRKDGEHHLVIEDVSGRIVYDGPFDPETGVAGLPREARDQLETMKLDNFEIRLPEPPEKESEEKSTPPEEEPDDALECGVL